MLLLCFANAAEAQRYGDAVRTELNALDVEATCEVPEGGNRLRCSWQAADGDGTRSLEVRLILDDARHTLYLSALVGTAQPSAEPTNALLRRLGEYNWSALSTKLEWHPVSGAVRLSALQHTDSNFDRRAFRALVRLMNRESIRVASMLERTRSTSP